MTEVEEHAEEMLRLMKLCPGTNVTERTIAVAFLARERCAGKVDASAEIEKTLFGKSVDD